MGMIEKQCETARQSMIESQIHPMGVVSEPLLKAFHDVPREEFVPNNKRGICYCDEDIEVSAGRYLMEPSVLARLIQESKPQESDVALTIGSGIGYNAAIIGQLVSTVIALEDDQDLLNHAQASWDKLGYTNIAAIKGDVANGAIDHAPYDIIILNGAVAEVPKAILQQLSVGGRLVALVKQAGQSVAKATLFERFADDVFSNRVLFDAGTPYLKGFEPKKEFVF